MIVEVDRSISRWADAGLLLEREAKSIGPLTGLLR